VSAEWDAQSLCKHDQFRRLDGDIRIKDEQPRVSSLHRTIGHI